MDIKKYEVFLKAIERGSLNNVSDDMGYTHSGISKMMNSMEKELGFPLIKRNNKGISLTAEGEAVIDQIRLIVNENAKLEEQMALIKGVERGVVRVGTFPTLSITWLPGFLNYFHEKHPGIGVEVIEDNDIEYLEQGLSRGVFDVGLMSKQEEHKYKWYNLVDDEYVVLLPSKHRLVSCDMITAHTIEKENLILFKNTKGYDQDIIQLAKYMDLNTVTGFTCNSDLTVAVMVQDGDSIALVPRTIAEFAEEHFEVQWRPFRNAVIRRVGFAVKSNENLSPSVKCFLKEAKNYFQKEHE